MRIQKIIFCVINVCRTYIKVCSRNSPFFFCVTITTYNHSVNTQCKLTFCFLCVCEPQRHLLANSPLYHSQHHQHALANGATKSHHYHHHQSPSSHSSYSPASSSTGYAYPPFTTTQQHPQQQQQQQHPQQQQVILSTPARIDGEDLFLKPYL